MIRKINTDANAHIFPAAIGIKSFSRVKAPYETIGFTIMNRFVIVVTMTTNIRKNIDTINTYTKRVTKACVPRVKEKKVKTEYAAATILVGLFNRCCLRKSTNEMTKTAIE